MTDPAASSDSPDLNDEERARAGHVRRLRTGNATSEGYRRKRQREARSANEAATETAASENEEEKQDDSEETGSESGDPDFETLPTDLDLETLLAEIEDRPDVDAVELPEDAEDLSVLAVPVHEEFRREFNRVADALGMRYGFAYERDLDPKHHVRPLAMYLGMRQLEDADPKKVRAFLERTDELESP